MGEVVKRGDLRQRDPEAGRRIGAAQAQHHDIVVAVLDNLNKGSSGQAMQNANLMLGLDETMGLMLAPIFP